MTAPDHIDAEWAEFNYSHIDRRLCVVTGRLDLLEECCEEDLKDHPIKKISACVDAAIDTGAVIRLAGKDHDLVFMSHECRHVTELHLEEPSQLPPFTAMIEAFDEDDQDVWIFVDRFTETSTRGTSDETDI